MKVYFSGICGVGIGPLAELAKDAGFEVFGSDMHFGKVANELIAKGIEISFEPQDGSFLRKKFEEGGVDWFVHTSALPKDHPEIQTAKELGIHVSKRDEFLAKLLDEKQLKLIGVAGTHGKTTTSAMLVWAMKQLGIPVSHSIGTTMAWAPAGFYDSNAEYFVYEADEFDRNFLAYHPYIATVVSVEYDHKEIYPTVEDYRAAFAQYESQSKFVVKDIDGDSRMTLSGQVRRLDASFAFESLKILVRENEKYNFSDEEIIAALNSFPGAGRRFEEITHGVFSDYGHLPSEIRVTLDMAFEHRDKNGYAGLALVYEPLQNRRQYTIRHEYKELFFGLDKLFWVPSTLIREEGSGVDILTPAELIEEMDNKEIAEPAECNEVLAQKLHELHEQNWMILLMSGGDGDHWLREQFLK